MMKINVRAVADAHAQLNKDIEKLRVSELFALLQGVKQWKLEN